MIRAFLAAALLAALPLGCCAGEAVVQLKVQAAAAPKPALKYQLLPEVSEMNPGNPVQWYLRCFGEQRIFFYGKESVADRARYRSIPLAELPAENLRTYGGNALRQADWAARLDAPDWQVLQRVQNEGIDLLLPEQGPLQVLAAALQVRFRGQVASRHFDEATTTAKTMFALARHLGEHPTEAANLGGLSVAHLALNTLEEMVQQKGCPNLYWALTDLPCPLVDLRKGIQGHRALVAAELRLLRDTPMTEAEIDRVVGHLSGAMGFAREQAGQPPRSLRARLAEQVKDAERVRAARSRLVAAMYVEELGPKVPSPNVKDFLSSGWQSVQHADTIKKLSPMQIILLDEKREYEARRDERAKLLALAPWQIDALAAKAQPAGSEECLFADLLPPILEARRAQARLEQRISLLRHVEALRLHAAEHHGKLPEKLSDVLVPLPADPFTGKPFVCSVEAGIAHLHGSPTHGEEKEAACNFHYEVTIQK
jgi:hypothetical protein